MIAVPVPFDEADALGALTEFVRGLENVDGITAAVVHDVGLEFDDAGRQMSADQMELVSNTVSRTVDAIAEGLRFAMLRALSDKVEAIMAGRAR